MQRQNSKASLTRIVALTAGVCLLSTPLIHAKEIDLPECAGVEIPEGVEMPTGIAIPDNFEITCDMVAQYIKYLEEQQMNPESEAAMEGDKWFYDFAEQHPNQDIQTRIKNVDLNSANEESAYEEKFMDTFLSKAIILPAIAVILFIITLWAVMTKCGRKGCCAQERSLSVEAKTKKSVKGDKRVSTPSDIDLENRSNNLTNINSDGGSSQGKQSRQQSERAPVNKQLQADEIQSVSVKFSRASVGSSQQARQQIGQLEITGKNRQSTLSAPMSANTNTANRLSLPTVSVPMEQIRSKRSTDRTGSDNQSQQRPSLISR